MSARLSVHAALALSFALLGAGCYGNPDSFADAAAKQSCKRLADCNRSAFEDRYSGDMGRCRDDQSSDLLDTFDTLDDLGCEYDPAQGRECISVAKKYNNTCDDDADRDIADACVDVYDCPGLSVPDESVNWPDATIAEHIMAPAFAQTFAE